jgi:hypothetical protein
MEPETGAAGPAPKSEAFIVAVLQMCFAQPSTACSVNYSLSGDIEQAVAGVCYLKDGARLSATDERVVYTAPCIVRIPVTEGDTSCVVFKWLASDTGVVEPQYTMLIFKGAVDGTIMFRTAARAEYRQLALVPASHLRHSPCVRFAAEITPDAPALEDMHAELQLVEQHFLDSVAVCVWPRVRSISVLTE